MSNPKLMIVIYVVATILCAAAGVYNFTKGSTSNGFLWVVASACWGTCVYNTYNNNKSKK